MKNWPLTIPGQIFLREESKKCCLIKNLSSFMTEWLSTSNYSMDKGEKVSFFPGLVLYSKLRRKYRAIPLIFYSHLRQGESGIHVFG